MSAGDKLALAMIPKIDIRCAAILMLKRYGEKALEENNAVSYFITTAGHSSFEPETDTRLRTIMNGLPPMTSLETASLQCGEMMRHAEEPSDAVAGC